MSRGSFGIILQCGMCDTALAVNLDGMEVEGPDGLPISVGVSDAYFAEADQLLAAASTVEYPRAGTAVLRQSPREFTVTIQTVDGGAEEKLRRIVSAGAQGYMATILAYRIADGVAAAPLTMEVLLREVHPTAWQYKLGNAAYELALVAPRPLWRYTPAEHAEIDAGGGSASGTYTLPDHLDGAYILAPRIEFTPADDGDETAELTFGGNTYGFADVAVTYGQKVVVDTMARRLQLVDVDGTAQSIYHARTGGALGSGSYIFELIDPAGGYTWTYSATSALGAAIDVYFDFYIVGPLW